MIAISIGLIAAGVIPAMAYKGIGTRPLYLAAMLNRTGECRRVQPQKFLTYCYEDSKFPNRI